MLWSVVAAGLNSSSAVVASLLRTTKPLFFVAVEEGSFSKKPLRVTYHFFFCAGLNEIVTVGASVRFEFPKQCRFHSL